MSASRTSWAARAATLALLLALGSCVLGLAASCKSSPSPEAVRPATPEAVRPAPTATVPSADDSEPDEQEEDAPEATRPPGTPAALSNALDPHSGPVPAVDPARIPVEEDFVQEAEARITRRSNLERELARIATEIKAH